MIRRIVKWLLIILFLIIMEFGISNYSVINSANIDKNVVEAYEIVGGDQSLFADENYQRVIRINIPEKGISCQNVCIYYKLPITSNFTYKIASKQKGVIETPVFLSDKCVERGSRNTRINVNSTDLCYRLDLYADNLPCDQIEKVVVNDTEIKFNLWRVLGLILLAILITGLIKLKGIDKYNYSVVYVCAVMASIMFVAFITVEMGGIHNTFYTCQKEQIVGGYEELTYSFRHHSFTFIIHTPDEKLMNLSDIYDYTLRESEGASYLFDDVYYDGSFSTYFGITPVLELMLPYCLLTGNLLSTFTTSLLYMILLFFALAGCYKIVFAEYFDVQPNLVTYIVGYYTVIIVSGVLQLAHGAKYHLATVSAIVHVLIAVLLAYGVLKTHGKKRGVLCALLGLCLGLIVLSKPSFIVYYPLIMALIILRRENIEDLKKVLLLMAIPLVMCAVFQMYYNYSRYNSIIEFGTNYMTGACHRLYSGISIRKILKEIILVLFTPPKFTPNVFPFVSVQNCSSITGWNTWHIADKIMGLCSVPVFYVVLKRNGLSKKKVSGLLRVAIVCGFLSTIIPVVMGFINDEYLIDLRLILMVVVLLVMIDELSKDGRNTIIYITLWVVSVLVMIPCGLEGNGVSPLTFNNQFNMVLRNIFEFWS